jgi:class 3 adenylate cyclase
MRCPSCDHENRAERRFCAECGAALAAACASCGAPNQPGEKFCGGCGAALTAALATAPAGSPVTYTPKHLADKILTSRSALEGERKQVTVLFADVEGSMELAEQLDPEAFSKIMQRFFRILSEGVERFEGFVDKFTGDGIMALFGAPLAHEDHAQRACYAGLHLQDQLRAYTREVKRTRGVDFSVRLGLNSGEVIVGKIGDDLRMDYTAQGHTVGLAQRMEALASGGSVYLTARTAGLVAGYFELADLGEFAIKGVSEAVRAFELCGVGAARTRFDLSRARGLTRVVGRADEMALLLTALDQALAGPGRTVGVVAQAGTGKTRLCHEFITRCRGRGLTVYEARGLAHGKHIPLLPVLELMRAFFGIDARDSELVAREKISGRLLGLDESLRDELPLFFELLVVPDPARPLPAGDPEALQRRLHAAIRRIAQIDGERDPGVLLIEDLHWLDPTSDAVLHQIIEGNAASRSLVLVNFRPQYQARWMRQSHYQQLSLLPLSEGALRELLDELLGQHPSVAALPAAIYARTRGNPFFIEEIVQSLVDDGHLAGQRGAYRLTTQVETLPLPESVHGVLAARIDRLPEREKHVLQSAAVIGKTFRERVLRRVVDQRGDGLGEALRALQDGEFLYEAALYPELEYTFKHPLTQEVAANSQLSEGRTRAHALAVLICHYAALRQSAGHLPEYLALIEEAMVIARRTGDPATRAALALDLLWARLLHGSLAAAVDAADELLLLVGDDARMGADVIGYSPLFASLGLSAIPLTLMGQLAEAERRLQQALRLGFDAAAPETLSWISYAPVTLAAFRGDPGAALRAGQRCLEQAERSGSRFEAVAGRCYLGQAHVTAGNWRDAAELLEDAAARGREQTIALDIVCMVSWALPAAYLGLGDIGRARARADAAVELCRAQRARVSLCRAHLARAAVARADPRAQSGHAKADLDAAEQLVAETGARALQPLIHEGRAALTAGAARERELREAHRLYEEMRATGHAQRIAAMLGDMRGSGLAVREPRTERKRTP